MKKARKRKDRPSKQQAAKPRLTSYHFDVGNSSTGPIGLCARVTAADERSALRHLQDMLPEAVDVFYEDPDDTDETGPRIEYVQVYLNADAITINDIDDGEAAEYDN